MNREEIISRIKKEQVAGGRGSSTWTALKETRIPTSEEADQLEHYNIPFDIDPEIRTLVISLNEKGYKTYGSCAGHRDRGFLVFSNELSSKDKEEIKKILNNFGLKNLKEDKQNKDNCVIYFSPIGKTLQQVNSRRVHIVTNTYNSKKGRKGKGKSKSSYTSPVKLTKM